MATALENVAQPPAYSHQLPSRPRPLTSKSDSPITPRTPILGRSISGAFGSPGSYSREADETIVFELNQRQFSAGFAGEARPRCIWRFGHRVNESNRTGDFSQYQAAASRRRPKREQSALYSLDLRTVDLGLVHDRFERIVQSIHTEILQLDQKLRKAILVVPTLLPTRILDVALNVLFNHYTQPPSITLLSSPVASCVSAGLRNSLVIDIGWEESVVTAIGEYKIIDERRSTRADRMLVDLTSHMLSEVTKSDEHLSNAEHDFALAEEVRNRFLWCKDLAREQSSEDKKVRIPVSASKEISVPFEQLCEPVEQALFASQSLATANEHYDDNELPLPDLAYDVLAHLSRDLRASCAGRIVITGSAARIPGLKRRLLSELQQAIDRRRWRVVKNYGSAQSRNTFAAGAPEPAAIVDAESRLEEFVPHQSEGGPGEEGTNTISAAGEHGSAEHENDSVNSDATVTITQPEAGLREHDDIKDPVTQKAERESSRRQQQPWSGQVR